MIGEKIEVKKIAYKLELTEEEMNTILASIAKVTFGDMQGFADEHNLTILKWNDCHTENEVFYKKIQSLVFDK
jgi:hypothetical protein